MRQGPLAPAPPGWPGPPDRVADTVRESPEGADARPATLRPGASFGAYRIVRRLGRGGMGEVFLAFDERLGRRVAIKCLRTDAPAGDRQRQRFRREARAAARLNHPSIVQVFDLIEDEGGDAIVMEFVEGSTLAELVAHGPCDPALALRLGRDIALGLEAAHAAGFVHRDLKTDNVMLGAAGTVKILDFGLAKSLLPEADGEEALTAKGFVLGTFHTMSPEQARGAAADSRSDLFSFGVLMYELLTGQSPFRGTSRLDTLHRVLTHRVPAVDRLRPGLPPALVALVGRCLAKEPGERPASAGEVARALAAIALRPGPAAPATAAAAGAACTPAAADTDTGAAVGAGTAARGPARPSRGMPVWRRGGARRRWLLPVAGLALAALALVGALWQRARPSPPLRIAILLPTVSPPRDATLGLAAAAVVAASLGELGARQGLAPIGPREAGTAAGAAAGLAASGAAAQEALIVMLQRQGEMGRLSMVRAQGSDGRVLWSETFSVPVEPSDLGSLATAVAARLRRAYADHPRRPGAPGLEVRDPDYADFVRLAVWLDAGETRPPRPVVELDALLRQAPRFVDGDLVESEVYEELGRASGDPRDGQHACDLARRAATLAPDDPRPLVRLARAALAVGLTREAAAAVEELAERAPGDPAALELGSRLAEARGQAGEALAEMRRAAARVPSWRNLAHLARLEARHGELAEARAHFAEALARSPGNPAARLEQAEMELESGDLARAEEVLIELARGARSAAGLAALCRVRSLLGRYDAAAAACQESLAIAPGQILVGLDLGDALLAQGRKGEAEAVYAADLAALRRGDDGLAGGPVQRLAEARCLASLGRGEEAVALVQQTLQGAAVGAGGAAGAGPGEAREAAAAPANPGLAYQAAIVYALAGDRGSALDSVRLALAGGVPRRLFAAGGLRSLAAEPEFRALVAPAEGRAGPPARGDR